jgi:predicted glutamine amidotransferase
MNRGNKSINVNGLVKGMAISAMTRGTHATGISYNAGGNLCVVKSATPADKFVFDIPRNTSVVIGHTRHTTQGTEKDNFNNHPFLGSVGDTDFALAHNGVLDNDYDLQLDHDLPATKIKTDSYVAVQLIEKFADKSLVLDSIKQMSEEVQGMFAFSILASNDDFWLVRNDSPIYMVYYKKMKLYIYGSTEAIVNAGIKSAGLGTNYQVIDVPMESIMFNDKNNDLSFFEFDAHKRIYNWYSASKYAVANGGTSLTGTKTTTKVSSFDSYGGYRGYYDYEDAIRIEAWDFNISDEEFDLLTSYNSMSQIDEALYRGRAGIEDMLLETLRSHYADTLTSKRKASYTSPIHKLEEQEKSNAVLVK